jgi:protein gp37
MGDNSQIQWTDATWNPVTGCTKVSEGCRRCYIERTVPFRTQGRRFAGPAGPAGPAEPGATTGVRLHPERLHQPLRWRHPRRVFVNSLSDLFHPEVPDPFIAQVFQVMAAALRHTFQVLTKRPGRMASLLPRLPELINTSDLALVEERARVTAWPLANVWLGVSVEDQHAADLRIPALLKTPAAVRFCSCEPLLGPVDLGLTICRQIASSYGHRLSRTTVHLGGCCTRALHDAALHWIIVGGESGPGARPMDLAWARSLLAQCRAASVAVFVKQLGRAWSQAAGLGAGHGGDPAHWPVDLRVRELP